MMERKRSKTDDRVDPRENDQSEKRQGFLVIRNPSERTSDSGTSGQ